MVVVGELMDRHELHGGDAEGGEMVDDRGMRDAGVGASERLRDGGVPERHPAHMGLVDHAAMHRHLGWPVVAPIEVTTGHHAEGDVGRAVVGVQPVRIIGVVGVTGGGPVDRAVDGTRIGVEQEFRRVAPSTAGRLPRSVDAVAVALAGSDIGEVGVPDVPVDLGELDPRLVPVVAVEEAELDTLGNAREEREVRSFTIVGGAERVRFTGPHSTNPVYRGRRVVQPGHRASLPSGSGLRTNPL